MLMAIMNLDINVALELIEANKGDDVIHSGIRELLNLASFLKIFNSNAGLGIVQNSFR